MSPSIVVTKQTPQATEHAVHQHQWEEAELVSPDVDGDAYGGYEEQRPEETHADASSSAQSKNPFKSRNPFADAHAAPAPSSHLQSHTTFMEPPTPSAPNTPAADIERDGRAMQSLLAALNISADDATERLAAASQSTPTATLASRQSGRSFMTYSSKYSDAPEGEEDIANFGTFPLPPTDMVHHDRAP